MIQVQNFANQLAEAERTRVAIEPLISTDPDLTVDNAYYIQLENIKRRINAGQKIVGKKIGLTSEVVQKMLGVDEPDYGHLLDNMVIENGGSIPTEWMLQPKIEGEIAFILKEDLKGPNITISDVLNATDYVVPALEIVDSRIKDWKITLQDTVADNASSAFYVLGNNRTKVDDLNLPMIEMELLQNGEIINKGIGSAALGDPAYCVAWLANRLADYNINLKAGEVILSGALSGMVVAKKGDHFTAKFDQLGEVSVRFE